MHQKWDCDDPASLNCMHARACVCVCVLYIYTYIHAHVHIYIYICISSGEDWLQSEPRLTLESTAFAAPMATVSLQRVSLRFGV